MALTIAMAGVLCLVVGLASLLGGGTVAASRRLRSHSRGYGAAVVAIGVVLVVVGAVVGR